MTSGAAGWKEASTGHPGCSGLAAGFCGGEADQGLLGTKPQRVIKPSDEAANCGLENFRTSGILLLVGQWIFLSLN